MKDSIEWWGCYDALKEMLYRTDSPMCRVAVLYIMGLVARKYGGLMWKYHEAHLPEWLGLADRSGELRINCNDKTLCYAPDLCIKAFLVCRKRWMRKELEGIAIHAGPSFADVARLLLGEGRFPRWCGELPRECLGVLKHLGLA
jgi:hypothetical protein